MAAVPDDSSHSDGFTLRMCEDNTSHPVAMPKLQLYPPDYQPLPIEECFKECNVFMLEEALAYSGDYVDEHPEFVPSGMPRDCAVAIALYTYDNYIDKKENIYKRVNSCLHWRRSYELNKWKHYIWHLIKGLRLLEKVTSTVYRGIDKSNFTPELYKAGKRVVWNSVTSCSQIQRVAKSFMKDPSQGVFFFIKVSDGHKLGKLTAFPQEQEVVLEPGSEFVVTSAVFSADACVVNLEQIPSTHLVVPLTLSSSETLTIMDLYATQNIFGVYALCQSLLQQPSPKCGILCNLMLRLIGRHFPNCFPLENRECVLSRMHKKVVDASLEEKAWLLSVLNGCADIPDLKTPSEYLLGWCYRNGVGVVKDNKKAARLFTLAAQQGHPAAQFVLGCCYHSGDGLVKDHREAIRLFTLAAQQDHAAAQFMLGLCYLNGDGISEDAKEVVWLFTLAAQQGHSDAQNNLGLCYQDGYGVVEDSQEAVRLFSLSAQQGNPDAQSNLGLLFYYGDGVVQDLKEAVRLFTLSAQQGDANAQFHLGLCYHNGHGVVKDAQEAVRLFSLSAQHGVAAAQFYMGLCYYRGYGVVIDLKEAARLFSLSAQQDDVNAQFFLGLCYQNGNGVARDYKEAVRLFTLSAIQGHPAAQFKLGKCFYCGDGVVQNYKEAVRLFSLASQQLHSGAQFHLGLCYKNGCGVTQDFKKAVRFLSLSAQQGLSDAQFELGMCYVHRYGVEKDYDEAFRLFTLAAQQGHSGAQNQLRYFGKNREKESVVRLE